MDPARGFHPLDDLVRGSLRVDVLLVALGALGLQNERVACSVEEWRERQDAPLPVRDAMTRHVVSLRETTKASFLDPRAREEGGLSLPEADQDQANGKSMRCIDSVLPIPMPGAA
jgi:hypothetical protein